ncbi:MAG: hypothetical protein DWQ07_23220 [Chloroflexi bacterium]|nr:MAG: hypothetical protein DWQ07_23220 [Chloroflexota bacterium]MBL1194061.1 hypothetical protein [Chloroflexota bacterium]NOH11355.1 hypothetical protein [Chloroflexota bacterium]
MLTNCLSVFRSYCFLFSCLIFVGACSSVGNSGEEGLVPAAIQTEEAKTVFVPEPTLEGSWAGLPYGENWELRVVEEDEERVDHELYTYFGERADRWLYAYFEGQEVLVNRNHDGCELTYWFGSGERGEEFGEGPEFLSTISFEQNLGGNDFDVILNLVAGKLDYIKYIFDSKIYGASNVYENGYLGTLRLRLIDTEINPCIQETKWLLAEIDPSGMYAMRDPFMEWNNVRRFGVP